jgi:hypothetical protein
MKARYTLLFFLIGITLAAILTNRLNMKHILPTVITFKSRSTGYVHLRFDGGLSAMSRIEMNMNQIDSDKIIT